MVLTAAVALGAGAVGFWLGRQSRSQKVFPARHTAGRTPRTEEEAIWTLRAKAEEDDEDAVRIRLVHINDVYIMDNLPRLRKFLDDCCSGIRRENLVVCVGGDLLSPYPLSTLDKGRGMVEVMLESGVQYACFGNHEADVDLRSLKQRLERWRERGGIWINTNMPDLLPELGLPTYASVVGLSKDGDSSRQLCLLGVCTKDPSLYTDDADFGGAISTALDCNECIRDTAKELMDLHKLDPDAQKVDAVVALTHQDLAVDIELATMARSNGIHAVLGGHDHTEYLDQHNGCVLLKTGMDAQRVGVVDLLWQGDKDVPTIDFYDLIPLASFATSRAVSKSVQKHMRKLWNLEQLKARVHLSVFAEQPVMSSKNIRKHQTTLGSFLCSALRDEMQVDCVLFDGGNIRGDRDYIPSTEHYLGSHWVFTLSDLELELPWSSGMVEIVLDGEQVARAVRLSRTLKPGSGGFLQTDEGLWVSPEDQAQVTHIANEQWKKDRKYRVGMMHSSLVGMNHNPVFEEWCKANSSQIPKEDSSRPAKELIKKQLARRVWDQLPEFHDMNTSHSGALSKDEVIQAYRKTFSNSPDAAVEPSVDQLMAVADFGEKGELSPASYQGIFRLPTWVALSYFTAEQEMSSKDACIKQTSMGSFLCDALRSELDVDVVLFDGGNIRGNRDYVPVKGHHRGSKWAFTVTDLRRELPWPSEIAIVSMTGEDINKAVVFSRKHATGRFADFLRVQPPVKTKSGRLGSKVAAAGDAMVQEPVPGGFLQTNSRTQVTDHAVTHISGKPIVLSKRYKVALLHAALHGMNGNSVFEIWASTQGNVVPPFEACQPAAEHLTRHFTRLLWLRMPSFQILDVDKSKTISRDELLEGIPKGFPRARDPNIRRSLLRRLLATIELDSTGHITEEQYLKLHTKLKDSDSINFAEGDVFCDWAYWTSPQG